MTDGFPSPKQGDETADKEQFLSVLIEENAKKTKEFNIAYERYIELDKQILALKKKHEPHQKQYEILQKKLFNYGVSYRCTRKNNYRWWI